MSARHPVPVDTVHHILNAVGDERGFLRAEILSPSNPAERDARAEAMRRLYMLGYSEKTICNTFRLSRGSFQRIAGPVAGRGRPRRDGLRGAGSFGRSLLAAWPAIDAKLGERAQ